MGGKLAFVLLMIDDAKLLMVKMLRTPLNPLLTSLKMFTNTVKPVLEAAASNYFDEIFAQNLLSKNCILLRLLFEGGFYLRAASNTGFTVSFLMG